MYETLNWNSFLALNNSLGLATIPTERLSARMVKQQAVPLPLERRTFPAIRPAVVLTGTRL